MQQPNGRNVQAGLFATFTDDARFDRFISVTLPAGELTQSRQVRRWWADANEVSVIVLDDGDADRLLRFVAHSSPQSWGA